MLIQKSSQINIITLSCLLNFSGFSQVVIPNSGFEVQDKSSVTKAAHWTVESSDFQCVIDPATPYKGKFSLKLTAKNPGNHFFKQEFSFSSGGPKKYRVKGAFRTAALDGSVNLGARVLDKAGNTVSLTQFTLTNAANQAWKTGEGIFISDHEAAALRLFGNLKGTGEAWIDEITIEELPPPQRYPSTEVMLYIHEYFDYVFENSIVSDRFMLTDLKKNTIYLCADSIDKPACYQVLKEYTTRKLKDNHSFFSTPEDWKAMMEEGKHHVTGENLHTIPSGKMIGNNIALLSLPAFVSNDNRFMSQYADSLQRYIASFDRKETRGYIIDLSADGGGNCFPMIAGLGPLIGNGPCELSYSADGSLSRIIYNNGWTGRDSALVFQKNAPYQLKHPGRPVAVIYGKGTASSGEVVALSFVGLPNTRSFGQPTAGLTTRVDNFAMSDGAYLNLAAGISADRTGKKYQGPIMPDEETSDREAALKLAAEWILKQAQ